MQRKLGALDADYLQTAIECEVEWHTILREVLSSFYKLHLLLDQNKPESILKLVQIEDSRKLVFESLYATHVVMRAKTHGRIQ